MKTFEINFCFLWKFNIHLLLRLFFGYLKLDFMAVFLLHDCFFVLVVLHSCKHSWMVLFYLEHFEMCWWRFTLVRVGIVAEFLQTKVLVCGYRKTFKLYFLWKFTITSQFSENLSIMSFSLTLEVVLHFLKKLVLCW